MSNFYALTSPEVTELERKNQEEVRRLAAECMVLLKNDGALPLAAGSRIALYGAGARHTIKGGTGSGDVNTREIVNIEQGLEAAGFAVTSGRWLDAYDRLYEQTQKDYLTKIREEAGGRPEKMIGLMFEHPFFEPDTPEITEADVAESGTDTAVFVITRNSGEGKDRIDRRGDYRLTEGEERAVRFLAGHYKRCIVLLNVGGVIDLSVLDGIQGVNAVLLTGQPGNIGGYAIADALAGTGVPSGKLTDTWAKQYSDYPSSAEFGQNNGNVDDEYYKDGIYVGYRYFDTFGVEPEYCFGYGLSYTTFALRPISVSAEGGRLTVSAEVENTGAKHAGREVVQVYVSALGGELEKPYQELTGFAKTKLLLPGEKETVRITFDAADMASYDVRDAAWKLEAGKYIIRVGSSSRNTAVAATVSLAETVVTEQLKNLFALDTAMEEFSANGEGADKHRLLPVQEDSVRIRVDEIAQLTLDPADIPTHTAVYDPERPALADRREGERITLGDVKNGRATLSELVAQLTAEELAALCVGRFGDLHAQSGMIGSSSAAVPGAAADTISTLIESRGIPNMILADGPAGLRLHPHFKATPEGRLLPGGEVFGLDCRPFPADTPADAVDYYQYCTAIPIACTLAQSWDMELLEQMGHIVGAEMKQFHVHFWLAPGMNIHRNPLCGRNFEYYSEEPVLSGKCAAAMTRGVQSYPGQGTTIKHFAGNNLENNRQFNNSHIGERAMREIYLKGFEIAVKESQPYSIMTSYNLINGTHAANHYELIQNVARDEWGFEGVVMTDWFTTQDTSWGVKKAYPHSSAVQCIRVGNDLIMPGCEQNVKDILAALTKGEEITLADLQFCAMNILKIAARID
ncbi:MAG: glycoside hydrolase family 3 C-terminal domain-containing protein [Lachnospiraceae bacterium]|nr:glycoside hydrolase family 3 C-terminal domain-containing protein [Lachnospiraceae bacterium]